MFLKRLEIQGFKSFPKKVYLEFKNEITGIVGPNGSGKSNISDAIRWVLGEQSAKMLRGDKMEDIIFSGTKNRKPLSFAEVTMYLDNKDKKLPLEYNEISISRKIYRSGESGYYINGTSCRLKDIHELFMDTGIGKEGYSIIGQGKIDAILSTKSEDRRALFEEAVGITKFKTRRIQAENRLESIRKNLTRTNDIILELERQLQPLFKQQEKAKEFLALSSYLKAIQINLFVLEYEKAEDTIKNILQNIEILDNTILSFKKEKENCIKEKENLKNNILEKEKDIEKINNHILSTNLNIEKNKSQVSLDKQNIEFLKEDIERIKKEKEKNTENIDKKDKEINLIKVSLEAKNLEYSMKKEELENLYVHFENISSKMDKNEEEFKNINNLIVEKMQQASLISNKHAIYNISKDNLEKRLNNIEEEIVLFKSKIKEKTTRKEVIFKELEKIKEEEDKISQNINICTLNFIKNQDNLYYINKTSDEDNKKYLELKNKYKILKELEKDYEGYFNSVKSILKEKEQNEKFNGICGAVGELINVSKEYEIAIEIALGGNIQNIVTKTEDDAKAIIEYLKKHKKGRATFLPISSIKENPIKDMDILKEKGVINIADRLITFDNIYKNIMSSLLGKTIIVDSIDKGIRLAKKYKYMYKIVTLDGDVINNGGALTGGSVSKKTAGIFSRGRELKNILNDILEIEQKIANNKTIIKEKETLQSTLQKTIDEDKKNINNISLSKIKLQGELAQEETFIKNLEENIKNNDKEKDNIKNTLNKDISYNEGLKQQLNNIHTEIEDLKSYIRSFEIKLEEEKQIKNTNFNYINKLKINIKEIEYEIENSKKDINRIQDNIKSLENDNVNLQENIKINNKKQELLNNNIMDTQKNIEHLEQQYKSLKEEINLLSQHKNKINDKIEYISNDILKYNSNIADLENKKTKLELKKENIEEKIENLADNMWLDYEITYANACNDYERANKTYEQLKKDENIYKKKISNLGNVNVGAIEEYKIVKERYDLNIKQREDILKADEDLKDIIATLVTEMEAQFKEHFSLINKNFNKVFSDIFGGGKAELILSDEDNILTSGIEIVAQPPGKNLQSLTLLSGGERTLTAISLLFAILIIKPSPFCVLDETEASLDDANVLRYANFLKKFSKSNQFIIITHKTKTMEIADILYGITMQEQGVSKVISVELKEAKEYEKNKGE